MTFNHARVTAIKTIRAATGLGLKEAYEVCDQHPALSAEEIIQKLTAPTEEVKSNLLKRLPVATIGYWVESPMHYHLRGFHRELSRRDVESIQKDPSATIEELIRNSDATEFTNTFLKLKD
jgi:hypothetical protein